MKQIPVLTFFNNKSGVGKTSLIYHLSWMLSSLRKRILIVDTDPQCNLSAAFLEDDELYDIWNSQNSGTTIFQCVRPLAGVGDIADPVLHKASDDLYVLPGDIALSSYEDILSNEWLNSMGDHNLYRSMRILTSFWQAMQLSASKAEADLILVDIGPNLGAINRSVLLAADYVVIPLGADLFSLQGLSNLGPTIRGWQNLWEKRLDNWENSDEKNHYPDFLLPSGLMKPIGYICQQYMLKLECPIRVYDKWVLRIPSVYRQAVLNEPDIPDLKQKDDPYCLAIMKHFRSLIPMGQEKRKPIFYLTSADGAIGSHAGAVRDARDDYKQLAEKIAAQMNIPLNEGE